MLQGLGHCPISTSVPRPGHHQNPNDSTQSRRPFEGLCSKFQESYSLRKIGTM